MNSTTFESRGNIGIIQIDHTPRNAVTLQSAEQLLEAITQAMASPCRALVITGTGDSFCAGMNLKEVPSYTAQQQRRLLEFANKNISTLYRSPKPVIAAINGHAVGAGLTIALVCDYRIAADGEHFAYGLTEARAGIPFPACPAVVVKSELAPQDLRYLTLYSKNVSAQKIHSMRVVDEIVPHEQVLARAMEVAEDMASIPADSYAMVKGQLRGDAIQAMNDIVENNSDPMMSKWVSDSGMDAADSVLSQKPQV
ncbi:enoyl-CoA hydratase/isomerase family protein [Pseudoteredinibacter isoporae]|uniref:enoyl-CoA hydratase/isomerase family protein n=1 Tax=Pseudoteredinibacter isoporae TaxID=570281 RepID=UPI003105A6A3